MSTNADDAPLIKGVDPVTFEVIRHRLWAINDDQARMAARLSGSPIIYEGYDFNAALTTGDGRGLYCGVYILHHGATLDEFVRRLVETWDPEDIRPGDMFFTNDPWWGALHANDGILAMPIFADGELVAWSGIVLHDDDVGSPIPGSFVTGARDRFGEAPLFPAVRLARDFEPLRDVEAAYLRNSRLPHHNAINMRARIAALSATYRRITELIEQYGLFAFTAVQEGIIDYVERVVRARLREIPDGEWFAEVHHDHDGNDPLIYRFCCRVIKRGDELIFDMAGTDPQAPGSINCARPAMEGAVLGVVLESLCYDLPWAVGALRRVVRIEAEESTLNNASSPAAVSMASIMATLTTQDVVCHAIAKMLLTSKRTRTEAQATWTPGISSVRMLTTDRAGAPAFARVGDAFGGGGGARTFTDGIDSGGIYHAMGSRTANVETLESGGAVLQLFRRELHDGGGAGRFRGGMTIEFGATPHKAGGPTTMLTRASGVAMPCGRGLAGARPGSVVENILLRGTDVRDQFTSGQMPQSAADLRTVGVEVQQAKDMATVGDHDVFIGRSASGAGFGDPLLRDPARVIADAADRLVSVEAARALYGVALHGGADGLELDVPATAQLRDGMRAARLREARPVGNGEPTPDSPTCASAGGEAAVLHPVGDVVEAVQLINGERVIRCTRCHHNYGPYDRDYKRASVMRELPLQELNPYNERCSDAFVAREFYCPGCGVAIALDVQLRGEPVLDECRFTGEPASGIQRLPI